MKKKISLGVKMIICFAVAILGSIVICGVITYSKTKGVLNDNMKLTSEQTLEQSMTSLETYEKTLSLPVDLLTRKDSIKMLELDNNYDTYITNVQDELVAACKVTNGAVRSYYATANGRKISGWIEYDSEGKKLSKNSILEGVDSTGEDWYKNAPGRKAKVNAIFSYITKPYKDKETGKEIITVSQEVKYNDVVMGVVAMDVEATALEEYVQNIKLLNTGFVVLTDADGNIIVNSEKNTFAKEGLGDAQYWKPITDELASLEEQKTALADSGDESADDIELLSTYSMKAGGSDVAITAMTEQVTGWKLVGFINSTENEKNIKRINRAIQFAGVFGLIFGIIIAIATSASLIKEIKKIRHVTAKVAGGDFTETIKITSKDEFGELEADFNSMIKDVSGLIQEVEVKSHHILAASDQIAEIAADTKNTIGQVTEAIGSVANGAVKQAESTQEATAQVENLDKSLEASRDYAAEINKMAEDTNGISANGLESVQNLITKSEQTMEKSKVSLDVMSEMTESINKVFYISDAIADITSQTNLLSLNASIEAARAGEMGRGFSVVADEIRQLADESKKSTDEIKAITTEITEKSKMVEKAIQENEELQKEQQEAISATEQLFQEIIKQVEALNHGMERIHTLNDDMSEDKQLVVSKMEMIASVSEQSAAATEEVNASTEQVNTTMADISCYTEQLQKIAEELKETIQRFHLADNDQ